MQLSTSLGHSRPELAELCRDLLGHQRLVIASNRGPVEHGADSNGAVVAQRGGGGLVTALSGVAQYTPLAWVACAMTEEDRLVARQARNGRLAVSSQGQDLVVRYAVPSPEAYHSYYSLVSNPLLWFVQHYLWGLSDAPAIGERLHRAWDEGYVPVNGLVAKAIVSEAQRKDCAPFVMIHDYQLYLVASLVRRRLPHVVLQHFIHIPWPAPDYWQFLPTRMRYAICRSLCANDIIGFQTGRYAQNFLQTCERVLPQAQVDCTSRTVKIGGHVARVRAYPISIDAARLRRTIETPDAKEYQRALLPLCGEQTIVRVDRLDPSKNIARGFQAFDLLLRTHPELHGRVNFLAFLVPSRTDLPEYRLYKESVDRLVCNINSKYGSNGWVPIRVFYENNYIQALAAMSLYDVLLVNPVIDGMNLVAKEGPIVNTRHGVLVLSEMAGAYEQLSRGVVPVAPTDIPGTADALHRALTMPQRERQRRHNYIKRVVAEEDLTAWLFNQLEDLRALAPKGTKSSWTGSGSIGYEPSRVAATMRSRSPSPRRIGLNLGGREGERTMNREGTIVATGLLAVIVTLLLAACASQPQSAGPSGTAWGTGAFGSNGERIYFTATSERGTAITYTSGPESSGWMMGNG